MLLCFGVFLAGVMACLILGRSLIWALLLGLALFSLLGLKKGFTPRQLAAMAWHQGRDSLIVVPVFLLIGMVTALWRASGTISFFLYYGLEGLRPASFLLVAFLLSAVLSFALGTCYGVTGTAGVVLITLARSGGALPAHRRPYRAWTWPSPPAPFCPAPTSGTAVPLCPPAPRWWRPARGQSFTKTSGRC